MGRDALLEIVKNAPSGSIVIDIGAGDNVLEPFFEDAQYIALDSSVGDYKYSKLDVLGDCIKLPFADSSVDIALLVWVMEHVCEPHIALKEVNRILKPGGVLYILAPQFLHVHMKPYDFFRYTRYGMEYMLKTAGFENNNIKPSSGALTSLCEIGLFSVYNIYQFITDENITKTITVPPMIKDEIKRSMTLLSSLLQNVTEIDKVYINNNIDLMESSYPTDFICVSYKTGELSEPEYYENKTDLLRHIMVCPQCRSQLPQEYFDHKESQCVCINCNNEFGHKGNIYNFI